MSVDFGSNSAKKNLQQSSALRGGRFLVLGGGDGWHANQLKTAAAKANCELAFAPYETLAANVSSDGDAGDGDASLYCSAGSLNEFDAILTRTMPPGSLEKITFRLAILHACVDQGLPVVNSPRGLEIAIDKFATLQCVANLGFRVPQTRVVQSRSEAMDAYNELGGDCVVKPLFGGEGRGVMRIRDPELAWYSFASLDQLGAVFYVQKFVRPGGRDTRILLIGDKVIGLRRESEDDFRTNVIGGATCRQISPANEQVEMARKIVDSIGVSFASVDIIDSDDDCPRVLEVNAVPGWRGAQKVADTIIADHIITLLQNTSASTSSNHRGVS